eukprot:TRINITY_DN1675_c0_g1_i1.p1 TRINITY_DN1675_c0_g1~~TRINITY_DN1675_c0_g1_i1.p1  ORF type:complete len:214 (-),score=48.68 TRINITY_DN1675_c0_g1_i1:27-668(-)
MSTKSKTSITIKGSAQIVSEFFFYATNSVLYQRGIYPQDDFEMVKKYGLAILVSKEQKLKEYLTKIMGQVEKWLMEGDIQQMVIVITGIESKQILERWVFNIETDKESLDVNAKPKEKSVKEIKGEIAGIIRQITASVTFLPYFEERCSFDILVYTDKETQIPKSWETSDAKLIKNCEQVKLRSFDTKIHKVDTMVSYKMEEENIIDENTPMN